MIRITFYQLPLTYCCSPSLPLSVSIKLAIYLYYFVEQQQLPASHSSPISLSTLYNFYHGLISMTHLNDTHA